MIGSLLVFVARCLGVLAGSFVVVFVFQFFRWVFQPITNRLRVPEKGDLWSDIDGRLIVVLDRNGSEMNLSRYLNDPTVGRHLGCWREDLTTFQDRVKSHGRKFVKRLDGDAVLAQWVAMGSTRPGGRVDKRPPQVSPSPDREG